MKIRKHPLRARILGDFLEAQGLGDSVGAELGVLRGETLFYLAGRFPRMRLLGVDAWEHRQEDTNDGGRSYRGYDLEALHDVVVTNASHYGGRVVVFRDLTAPAAARFADGVLDWVFIDADHTQAGVSADIEAWRPVVRAGGWLLGHDCTWPSVCTALDEYLPDWFSVDPRESVWAALRR